MFRFPGTGGIIAWYSVNKQMGSGKPNQMIGMVCACLLGPSALAPPLGFTGAVNPLGFGQVTGSGGPPTYPKFLLLTGSKMLIAAGQAYNSKDYKLGYGLMRLGFCDAFFTFKSTPTAVKITGPHFPIAISWSTNRAMFNRAMPGGCIRMSFAEFNQVDTKIWVNYRKGWVSVPMHFITDPTILVPSGRKRLFIFNQDCTNWVAGSKKAGDISLKLHGPENAGPFFAGKATVFRRLHPSAQYEEQRYAYNRVYDLYFP